VSEYVLSRALPETSSEFAALLVELRNDQRRRFALASLNDLLTGLSPIELTCSVADADLSGLSTFVQSYVAAMVEHAAQEKGVAPPAWTTTIDPLDAPWFATPLRSLRLHLLRSAPVAYRQRNLFVDSGLGDRV